MFTGLVEEVGKVRHITKKSDGMELTVSCIKVSQGAALGDSIAVNGVCLTVVDMDRDLLRFEVSAETIKRTNLSRLKTNDPVNLERAMMAGSRFGGHIVQGHIDSTGYISSIKPLGDHTEFSIGIPQEYLDYVIEKGSIAVDGISLTINYIRDKNIILNIIPHTLENTNLKFRKVGEEVNLEFDILGKYVVQTLKRYGFSKEDKISKLLENW